MTEVRITNLKNAPMGYNSLWSKVTGSLYKAVLTQAISSIVTSLLSIISVIMLMSDPCGYTLVGGFQTILILIMIARIGSLIGFILFFINITKLKEQVNSLDAKAVGNIQTAMILTIVSAIVSVIGLFLPFINIIAQVVSIIALVFQMMGYYALKSSTTFPTTAREGARKVFNAIIVNLVAGIVASLFILQAPVISILAYVAIICAWTMQLRGWALIAKSEEPL